MKKIDLSNQVVSLISKQVFLTEDCINFEGTKDKDGYGRIYSRMKGKRFTFQAHRVSFVVFKGNIPDGLLVCHICDNTSCINPKHLWLGTHQLNIADRHAKGRTSGDGMKSAHEARRTIPFSDITQMRDFYKNGRTKADIARMFNISQSLCNKIIEGKRRLNA